MLFAVSRLENLTFSSTLRISTITSTIILSNIKGDNHDHHQVKVKSHLLKFGEGHAGSKPRAQDATLLLGVTDFSVNAK